jgi:hypothetical protein
MAVRRGGGHRSVSHSGSKLAPHRTKSVLCQPGFARLNAATLLRRRSFSTSIIEKALQRLATLRSGVGILSSLT